MIWVIWVILACVCVCVCDLGDVGDFCDLGEFVIVGGLHYFIYEGGRKSSRPPVYIAIVCGSFPVIYDY